MVDLITKLPGNSYLILPLILQMKMEAYRQNSSKIPESGGLIMGSLHAQEPFKFNFSEPPHIDITGVTEPGDGDIQERCKFVRQGKHHLKKLQFEQNRSQCRIAYLGEWHTHPELHPKPSHVDMVYWKQNLRGSIAIVSIIGIQTNWWAYWDGVKPHELKCFNADR